MWDFMMTRVDFYLIPEATIEARRLFACRLVDKAYRQGCKIYVYTRQEDLQLVDDQLWTFKDTSFVPHRIYQPNSTENLPVQVGCVAPTPECNDLLVNLAYDIPDFFNQFQRIAEIAPQDPEWRERARKHYRFYREKGCELESHSL
jgi:DNA polymerase III subunit chi